MPHLNGHQLLSSRQGYLEPPFPVWQFQLNPSTASVEIWIHACLTCHDGCLLKTSRKQFDWTRQAQSHRFRVLLFWSGMRNVPETRETKWSSVFFEPSHEHRFLFTARRWATAWTYTAWAGLFGTLRSEIFFCLMKSSSLIRESNQHFTWRCFVFLPFHCIFPRWRRRRQSYNSALVEKRQEIHFIQLLFLLFADFSLLVFFFYFCLLSPHFSLYILNSSCTNILSLHPAVSVLCLSSVCSVFPAC